MARYRVLLVEDDFTSQETIKNLLGRDPSLDVIGVAATVEEADSFSQSGNPDLVICDVMLPPSTSFDWLERLETIPFELIFTTSFDTYAVKAFRLAAVDYLLKPIDPNDFWAAIVRFKEKKGNSQEQIQQLLRNFSQDANHSKVALPTFQGYVFVGVNDIIHCKSESNYTTVHLQDSRKVLVSKTLKELELLLEPFRFFRIHNSHVINLNYVSEYLKGKGGQVKLSDGTVIDVSRRKKEEFLAILRNWR